MSDFLLLRLAAGRRRAAGLDAERFFGFDKDKAEGAA
jgi:hypothetical protein